MQLIRTLAPLVLLALLACAKDSPIESEGEGSDGASGDGGGGDGESGCATDDNCPASAICEGGECVAGDRNNAVEEAAPLLWEDTVEGYLNPAADVDYYTISAEGGEFIKITTTTPEEPEDEDFYNTVVVVRKPNGKVVTVADAFATETGVSGIDSVAFAYLPEAGDYVISVEDDGSYYSGGTPDGDAGYLYTLTLEDWETGVSEPDSLESPGLAFTLGTERSWVSLGFLLEEPGDVDYVSIDFETPGAVLYLDGNQNLEGSDATAHVALLDSAGARTAKSDVGPSDYAMAPNLEVGPYTLEVRDDAGQGGPNHWVFVHVIARTDAVPFTDEAETNDSAAAATTLPADAYENSSGKAYTIARVQGALTDEADEDWFEVEAPYEESYLVVCANGALWGSALAPIVEVYDETDTLVATSTGSAGTAPNARVENLPSGVGTWHLRVLAPDGTDPGLGAWYRLYAYVASFSVSPYEEGGYVCP